MSPYWLEEERPHGLRHNHVLSPSVSLLLAWYTVHLVTLHFDSGMPSYRLRMLPSGLGPSRLLPLTNVTWGKDVSVHDKQNNHVDAAF